jgi:hypothetical protein
MSKQHSGAEPNKGVKASKQRCSAPPQRLTGTAAWPLQRAWIPGNRALHPPTGSLCTAHGCQAASWSH